MREGERLLALGGVKQRSLLAILLLHAGEVVSVDRLIDALWGESPPDDAATALHQHVSRLRKALGAHEVLVTRSPGYVFAPAEGEIDFRRFEALRDTGRRHLEGDAPHIWKATRRRKRRARCARRSPSGVAVPSPTWTGSRSPRRPSPGSTRSGSRRSS